VTFEDEDFTFTASALLDFLSDRLPLPSALSPPFSDFLVAFSVLDEPDLELTFTSLDRTTSRVSCLATSFRLDLLLLAAFVAFLASTAREPLLRLRVRLRDQLRGVGGTLLFERLRDLEAERRWWLAWRDLSCLERSLLILRAESALRCRFVVEAGVWVIGEVVGFARFAATVDTASVCHARVCVCAGV